MPGAFFMRSTNDVTSALSAGFGAIVSWMTTSDFSSSELGSTTPAADWRCISAVSPSSLPPIACSRAT